MVALLHDDKRKPAAKEENINNPTALLSMSAAFPMVVQSLSW
jgi:hypothetical protein